MKKAITFTHYLGIFLLGAVIICAIFGNARWVDYLILLIIDIFVGIILQYRYDRHIEGKSTSENDFNGGQHGIFSYSKRVSKIANDKNAREYFSPSEIVYAMINLGEAKRCLTQQEYFFVQVVFEIYSRMKNQLLLTQESFVGLCNEIIAHFDLIAPYYKYSGNPMLQIENFVDEDKFEYRQLAKELLNDKKIFSDEWMALHEVFLEDFYK